ncbi:MAG: thioredoxin [Actinomycetota bacterium]|nr:thioredoxin [Actinomycetota bacterium]
MSVTMEHVVDVTDADFEQIVIEGSKTRPVVLDLWATWCGPCRTLSPILEKVAQERQGAFLLAKLDVDANPMVAGALGVQSIPTVVAFRDGEPATGFVGAYPEDEVNRFVDSILPTEAELETEVAHAEEEAGDLEGAEQRYRDALSADPDNREAAVGLGRILADRGDTEAALELVTPHLPDPDAERVVATIRVRGWAGEEGPGTLASAKRSAALGRWREALDAMLASVSDDRESARDAMVTVFSVLGDDDPLVVEYRRKLANALF